VRKKDGERLREKGRAPARLFTLGSLSRGLASLEAEEGSEVKRVFSPPRAFFIFSSFTFLALPRPTR